MNRRLLCVTLLLLTFSITSFAQIDIVIDGQKDDFYKTLTGPDDGFLFMSWESGNDNGIPDDDYDLSAFLWSAWDETYLYIYEEVQDDVVSQDNATNYNNDCLEIKIDPDPYEEDGTVWATRLTVFDSTDADVSVWAGIDNCTPEAWITGEPTYDDFFRMETDTGYVLELRFKWEWIGTALKGPVIPEVGNEFGLAYMNHDNDSGTREGSIEWATVLTDAVWNDCNNHGTVIFLEGNKLQYIAENLRTGEAYEFPEIYIPPAGTGVADQIAVIKDYQLDQNYPNPFNPVTNIHYSIPKESQVSLIVYDLLGKEIETLVDEVKSAGSFTAKFNGADLKSGVYFYKLRYDNQVITRKMMLLK